MKLTRRFLALLLALSMSLSMVTPAFASESDTIDEMEEPVVVVEEPEVEETEAPEVEEPEEPEVEETEPEVVETEAPEVEETEAPEVVETEAPEVEETEAPEVVETEPEVVETEPEVIETEPVVVETEPVLVATQDAADDGDEVTTIVDEDEYTDGTQYSMIVPAGETKTFTLGDAITAGMKAVIYGYGGSITYNDEVYEFVEGEMSFFVVEGARTIVATNNDTAGENSFYASIALPSGTATNPETLSGFGPVETAQTDIIEEFYYYTYEVAELEDGEVYLTATDAASIEITVNGGEAQVMPEGGLKLTVAAGDKLLIKAKPNTDSGLAWELNYPKGSEKNPLQVEFEWNEENTKATASFVIPKGETWHVNLGYINGMMLSTNGGTAVLQETENPRMPIETTLSGNKKSDKTYNLVLTYPVGSSENPAALKLAKNTATVKAGTQGYVYSWTAPANGKLTLTMNTATNWFYTAVREYEIEGSEWPGQDMLDGRYSDSDPLVTSDTITVYEGDVVKVTVNTYDPENPWSAPAGSVAITAAFVQQGTTADDPIMPEWVMNEAYTEGTYTITIPKKSTYYFLSYNINGMLMSINGAEPTLMKAEGMGRVPVAFQIKNTSTKAKTYTLDIWYPVGHEMNPEVVAELGTYTTSVAEGGAPYYLSYTPAEDGTLYFTLDGVSGDAEGDLIVNNYQYYSWDAINGYLTVEATAEMPISIQASVMPDADWAYPAADITWTVSDVRPGSEADPFELVWNEDETEGTITVTVEDEETKYYVNLGNAYGSGMMLEVMGNNYPIPAPAENRMPSVLELSGIVGEQTVRLYWPAGSYMNPLMPEVSTWGNSTILAEDDEIGAYYGFTAEYNGTLEFTANEGVDLVATIGSVSKSLLEDAVDGVLSMPVAKGDEVLIQVIAEPVVIKDEAGVITSITYPAVTAEWVVNYAFGNEPNPAFISPDENGNFSWTIAKKDTLYLNGYVNGQILTIKNASKLSVTVDGVAVKANKKGVISYQVPNAAGIGRPMPVSIVITNKNTKAANVTLNLSWPVGNWQNPAALKLGKTTASVPANEQNGYNYTWTAPANGWFTFKVTTAEGWQYGITEGYDVVVSSTYVDEEGTNFVKLEVHEGEQYTIMVNTLDPMAFGSTPAGKVSFTTTFTPWETITTSGKTVTLKYTDMTTGKVLKGNQVNWEIVEISAFMSSDTDAYEADPAEFDSFATIKDGKLKINKAGFAMEIYVAAAPKGQEIFTEDGELTENAIVYMIGAGAAPTYMAVINYYGGPVLGAQTLYVNDEMFQNTDEFPDGPMYVYWALGMPETSIDGLTYGALVKWKSSNTKVATIEVDEMGMAIVKPVMQANGTYKTGTTTITATAGDGSGKKVSFKLTVGYKVEDIELTSVKIGKKTQTPTEYRDGEWLYFDEVLEQDVYEQVPVYTVKNGQTIKFAGKATPKGAKNSTVYWGGGTEYATMNYKSGSLKVSSKCPSIMFPIYAYTNWSEDGNYFHKVVAWVMVDSNAAPVSDVDALYVRDLEEIGWGGWDPTMAPKLDLSNTEYGNCYWVGYNLIDADWPENNEITVEWTTEDTDLINIIEKTYRREIAWDECGDPCEWEEVSYVEIVPVEGAKKGTAKVTVSVAGVTDTFKVKVDELVSEIKVDIKSGGQWKNEGDFRFIQMTAGSTLKLKTTVDADASNRKYGYSPAGINPVFAEFITVKSSGEIKVKSNVPATMQFVVNCVSNDGNWAEPVVIRVIPRATNVHAYATLPNAQEKWITQYASNRTINFDITKYGNEIELSSLVYPFDAAQDVSWSTSNGKIAKVEEYDVPVPESEDGDNAQKAYKLVFSGEKYGKVTVYATANDGSKQKTSFTVNVSASVRSVEAKSQTVITTSGQTVKLANELIFNDGEFTPSNKSMTWQLMERFPELDEDGNQIYRDYDGNIVSKDAEGAMPAFTWRPAKNNRCAAGSLNAKTGVFKANTVKEHTFVLVNAVPNNPLHEDVRLETISIAIAPEKVKKLEVYGCDGETYDDTNFINLSTKKSVTTSEKQVILSPSISNGNKVWWDLEWSVSNDKFVVEDVYMEVMWREWDQSGMETIHTDWQYMPVLKTADGSEPYGETVTVTCKALDGSKKSTSFKVTFKAPADPDQGGSED